MKLTPLLTDASILAELGSRLEQARLARNITQAELARDAGVSVRTLARLEAGEPVRTSALVRVLRALGETEALERLLPEPAPRPLALLERRGSRRQRASAPRTAERASEEPEPAPWRWAVSEDDPNEER